MHAVQNWLQSTLNPAVRVPLLSPFIAALCVAHCWCKLRRWVVYKTWKKWLLKHDGWKDLADCNISVSEVNEVTSQSSCSIFMQLYLHTHHCIYILVSIKRFLKRNLADVHKDESMNAQADKAHKHGMPHNDMHFITCKWPHYSWSTTLTIST